MSSILVVESEGAISRLLRESLGIDGFQTVMVLNGDDAVQFALREIPHLIILDFTVAEMDGFEVIRRLRDHPSSAHIPILAISSTFSISEKVRAYDLGVDSYITGPFNTADLLAQVRRQLRRLQQSTLSPLTLLPGGMQLEKAINTRMHGVEPWSVLYLDLNNFKAFNDAYGFIAGNDMILLVSSVCQRVIHDYGNVNDFVGHIGGDDFVVVTTPERSRILCRHILERYKEQSTMLYLPEDLERGAINGLDRKGRPYQFPLVSLSIGVVTSQVCSQSMSELGSLVAEAKRNAKQSSNNIYYISPLKTSQSIHSVPQSTPVQLINNFGRNLWRFSKEDALAEFK
jgi:diguanylate cyclase (GGDEF)-like protein